MHAGVLEKKLSVMKMKNECDRIRNLILVSEYNPGNSENESLILNHINKCGECKTLYGKVKQADRIIKIMKKSPVNFENQEEIVEGIFRNLENKTPYGRMKLIDLITGFVERRKARVSFALLLFLIVTVFLFQNYTDASKISDLEKRFGSRWAESTNTASVLSEEADLLGAVHRIYKFINGETDYLDINKSWVLLRKDRFVPLLKTLGQFEENELKKIIDLNSRLSIDKDTAFNSRIGRDEIEYFKNYLQLLEDELSRRGKK